VDAFTQQLIGEWVGSGFGQLKAGHAMGGVDDLGCKKALGVGLGL
jgi:hypothetical protein